MKHAQYPLTVFSLRKQKGFTLIELLVVISLISILAAMISPVVGRAKRSAYHVSCVSNMRQFATALSSYAQDYSGNYPSGRQHVYLPSAPYRSTYSNPALSDAPHQIHIKFCKTVDWGPSEVGWSDIISKYINNEDIVWCPARYEWAYAKPRTSYEFKLWCAMNTRQDVIEWPTAVASLWEQWSYHSAV